MANRYPLIVDKITQRIQELPASDNLDLTGVGAVILPVGTTAQRPDPATIGMFRFNTDLAVFEGYNGIEWVNIQGAAATEFDFDGDLETLDGTEDLEEGSGTIDLAEGETFPSTFQGDLGTQSGVEDLENGSGTTDLMQ